MASEWLRPNHESQKGLRTRPRTCVRVLFHETPKAACALHIALCRCTALCPSFNSHSTAIQCRAVNNLWSLWVSCGNGRKSRTKINPCTRLRSIPHVEKRKLNRRDVRSAELFSVRLLSAHLASLWLIPHAIHERAQLSRARWMPQLAQRFRFDLTNALAGHCK